MPSGKRPCLCTGKRYSTSHPWRLSRLPLNVLVVYAAIMDIVLSQKCGIILVGDPHQQIYSFRGVVNSLCTVPHTHVYFLTQVR